MAEKLTSPESSAVHTSRTWPRYLWMYTSPFLYPYFLSLKDSSQPGPFYFQGHPKLSGLSISTLITGGMRCCDSFYLPRVSPKSIPRKNKNKKYNNMSGVTRALLSPFGLKTFSCSTCHVWRNRSIYYLWEFTMLEFSVYCDVVGIFSKHSPITSSQLLQK